MKLKISAGRIGQQVVAERIEGDVVLGPRGASSAGEEAERRGLSVLFVSASPASSERLRVDVEGREIEGRLRGARFGHLVRFHHAPASRLDDLRLAVMKVRPDILHISGHGGAGGRLELEASEHRSGDVTPSELAHLLGALGGGLRLVVLNACGSAVAAALVASRVGLGVGMRRGLDDHCAIAFSTSLYESLAFGLTVESAFEAALAAMERDRDVPELFPAADTGPESPRKRPLVGGARSRRGPAGT